MYAYAFVMGINVHVHVLLTRIFMDAEFFICNQVLYRELGYQCCHFSVCSLYLFSVPVVLGFEEISYTARESDGSVELCVNLTDPAVLRRDVTLNVHTLPGTASMSSTLTSS